MKRVYLLTGGKGSGKSTGAARFVKPTKEMMQATCVIDTEDSMSDIIEENRANGFWQGANDSNCGWGAYLRAYDRFTMSDDMLSMIAQGKLPWVSEKQKGALVEYYQWFISALDTSLKSKKFNTLIIDTIEPIEAAMTAWAEKNKEQSGWSGNRSYGKLETEAVRPLYDGLLEAISRRGVESIIMTSHLKRIWENDKPILNKVQPGGRMAVLSRLSSAMFWLVPSFDNADGCPAALVIKARLGKTTVQNGEWVTQRVLPRRIPHFTWKDIESYYNHPADLAKPNQGEVPTSDELQMMSEFLTDEQMRLMVIGAEIELEETKAMSSGVRVVQVEKPQDDMTVKIRQALSEGKPAPIVAQELGVALPDVLKVKATMQ